MLAAETSFTGWPTQRDAVTEQSGPARRPAAAYAIFVSVFLAATWFVDSALAVDRTRVYVTPGQSTDTSLREMAELAYDLEHSTLAGGQEETISYRLLPPMPGRSGSAYPLVVWLHGYGKACGTDNFRQLNQIRRLFYRAGTHADHPFYVLALQCPRNGDSCSWTLSPSGDAPEDGRDMIAVLGEVIDKTIGDYPIDPDRITVVGISGGGSACWDVVARYPTKFAACVPIAAGGASLSEDTKLISTPIWAFNGGDDARGSVKGVAATVAALNASGGTAIASVIPGKGHSCWKEAFQLFQVRDWLLVQNRALPSPAPGVVVDETLSSASRRFRVYYPEWSGLGVPIVVYLLLAATAFGCLRELRRKRYTKPLKNEDGDADGVSGDKSAEIVSECE
ncbi:MAG: PHB depolymerase family esterase [Pseudomonadota bacterium]